MIPSSNVTEITDEKEEKMKTPRQTEAYEGDEDRKIGKRKKI